MFSYRFAEEILQHGKHAPVWKEIEDTFKNAPLFIYPGKSSKNAKLSVLQKVMNTYFDRKFVIELGWDYHPYATKIPNSALRADYRKEFNGLHVQTEVQFGNMARWYSDVFKFQAAYSEKLIQVGVSVVPVGSLARKVDSNVANYERCLRELPSAELSITLPILLIGIEDDETTNVVDVSQTLFANVSEINGKNKTENQWRVVNGHADGKPMATVGPMSDVGRTLAPLPNDEEDE
jgi:hypothetical protein